jgi:hypothetical protein
MIRQRSIPILAALVVLGVYFPGCGGGGSASAPPPGPPPSSIKAVVKWDAPQSYTDNTLLVPSRDVQGYEIYLRQDLPFGPADNPVATAPSVDTSFDLATLSPPLSRGATYYVSVRVVTTYDTKSDFSPAVSFSIPQ